MKLSLTLALFLGLTSAVRIQHHAHHKHSRHGHHQKLAQFYAGGNDAWIDDCDPERDVKAQSNPHGAGSDTYPGVGVECQGFAQKKSISKDGSQDAWVDDCQPGRNPFIPGNGNAGTVTSYPGVGIECQGFSQKKNKHSLAQKKDGSQDAWVEDCQPGRNPFIPGNGNAGTVTSYPGVGIECQGFAQKKKQSLAQNKDQDYEGGTNAWIDDCSPDRVMNGEYGSGTQGAPGANAKGSFDKVGVECQGFAQRKSISMAQQKGEPDAWIDDCDPERNVSNQANPSGAGTYEEANKGSYPGVGVECQGFAQRAATNNLAQQKARDDAWIDDCDPERDVSAQTAPQGAGTGGSYPGVGVECQGFAQRKSKSLAQKKDGSQDAWVDNCDPNRDVTAQTSPGGAGTGGSYPGVGIECQGFAQKKKHNLAQMRDGSQDAWIDACDPERNVSAQTNPSGAGTYEKENNGSYPGVGVECQGFAQVSHSHKHKNKKQHHFRKNDHARQCTDDMPDCNGTNGEPGVDCCDE